MENLLKFIVIVTVALSFLGGCSINAIVKTEDLEITETLETTETIYYIIVTYSENGLEVYGTVIYSNNVPVFDEETGEYKFKDLEGNEWIVPGYAEAGWTVTWEVYQ